MSTTRGRRGFAKFTFIFLSILILALSMGCVYQEKLLIIDNDSAKDNSISSGNNDFLITINGSPHKVMNYSAIIGQNYTDVPNLIQKDPDVTICNFSGNNSAIADIALHDSRVIKLLREGGILEGVGWYVPFFPAGQLRQGGVVSCVGHPSLDISFSDTKGTHYRSFIVNETNRTVDSVDTGTIPVPGISSR